MREKAALLVAVLMGLMGIRYSYLTWVGQIQPVLATWLLFVVATSLSFWTYWSSKKHNLVSNIGNTVDLGVVWLVFVVMVLFGKSVRLGFNMIETVCLVASLTILAFWKLSDKHVVANVSLQIVMVVAYLPTIYQLWYAAHNTEPLINWGVMWLACIASLIPAILDRDKLAILYATRATLLVTILLGLMLRLELRP